MPRNDLFGRSQLPAHLSREGRVLLLGEGAKALIEGRLPKQEEALFLGGAVLAWLEHGGSLERDYLKVTKPKSHQTPHAIWTKLNAETAHRDEGGDRSESICSEHHSSKEQTSHD